MSLTRTQALELFASDDLIGIGMEADALRRRRHPEGVVTYSLDRTIHYTNFCSESCSFCAFYRPVAGGGAEEGYVLDRESVDSKMREAVALGATGVRIEGGLHPGLTLEWHEQLLRALRRDFPAIHLECYSAPEILAMALHSRLSVRDTLLRLRDAGLDSLPGGGAEILDDEVRGRLGRLQCLSEEWLEVHRTAHGLGLRSTASMMFGVGESFEQRVRHLERLHRLQEETGGFTAFIPWSFQPARTALGAAGLEEATAVDYLKLLAIARLFLANFPHLQSNCASQGLKLCQLGLRFGGDDAGSVALEERTGTGSAAPPAREEQLRGIIRDAGFMPVRRDTLYRTCFLN